MEVRKKRPRREVPREGRVSSSVMWLVWGQEDEHLGKATEPGSPGGQRTRRGSTPTHPSKDSGRRSGGRHPGKSQDGPGVVKPSTLPGRGDNEQRVEGCHGPAHMDRGQLFLFEDRKTIQDEDGKQNHAQGIQGSGEQ